MSTNIPLDANPRVIAWARIESGYPIERVAKRLHVPESRIADWESGERSPTLRQLEALAKMFHQPLEVFFMPEPPIVNSLGVAYRRIRDVQLGNESPEFRQALRQMSSRRDQAFLLLGDLEDEIPAFALKARLTEAPKVVGERLRAALGIITSSQTSWIHEWEAWRVWRMAAERLNVLVFQFAKVAVEEARSVALLAFPLPAIGVNSKSRPEEKACLLCRELIHLMLAASGDIEPAACEKRDMAEWHVVERFAERAATHALVVDSALRSAVMDCDVEDPRWDLDAVRRLAKRFRLPPPMIAMRLRDLGYMSWPEFLVWRTAWRNYVKALPPPSGGFATPVQLTLGRAGMPFTRLVLDALFTQRITPDTASKYLQLRPVHFDTLREHLNWRPRPPRPIG